MNKRAFGLAFICAFSICNLTACEAKAGFNGKTKEDYDLSNNIELSEYAGHEIIHDGVHFNIVIRRGENNHSYSRLKISSDNPNIKKYDIVEAYLVDLQGEIKNVVIASPISFKFEYTGQEVFYDFDHIYCHSWSSFDSNYDELRIIGENINFTYHLWDDLRDYGNGKKVEDYNCRNNELIDGYCYEKFQTELNTHNIEVEAEVKNINNVEFSDFLQFNINVSTDEDVDLVQIYASDANNENKRVILDKPFTITKIDKPEKNVRTIGHDVFGIEDLSNEYYNLCNQNVRFHIVTNCFTLILQTYNHIVNGKTKDDYDLSNLEEYKTYGNNNSIKNGGHVGIIEDKNTEQQFLEIYTFCDAESNMVRVTFINLERAIKLNSLDIVEAYFSDEDGKSVKSCLDAPITLHRYFDASFYFNVDVGNEFEQYYALCKNNIVLHIVTDIFIIQIKLMNRRYWDVTQYGDFIDEPITSYSELKELPEVNAQDRFEFSEDEFIVLTENTLMGLPYSYTFSYYQKDYSWLSYPTVDIFDIYFTDENGNNKMQCLDKVYRSSSYHGTLFNLLAPEYSYYLNNNKKVVLHLFTTWGNVAFHL